MVRVFLGMLMVGFFFVSFAQAKTVYPDKKPAVEPPLEVFVPPGWKLHEPFEIDYTYTARALLVSTVESGERISCKVTFREQTDESFKTFNQQDHVVFQLKTARSNFNVIETTPMTIKSRPAHRIIATWQEKGRRMKAAFYFLERDLRKVFMECACAASEHKRQLPIFDKIAKRLDIH